MKRRILVVADDAALRGILARWLLAAGYGVELAESAKRAHEVVANSDIALAIVAPGELGDAGMELVRELRSRIERLIVIEDQADQRLASDKPPPADGRISKSLTELEVLARVTTALGAQASGRELLSFDGYTLDPDQRACRDANGAEVPLTPAEFSILFALVREPGRVLSRDELSRAAAGRSAEPEDRSVDVLISRLRRKIEQDPKAPRLIVTVPGKGYRFDDTPQKKSAVGGCADREVFARGAHCGGTNGGSGGLARPDSIIAHIPNSADRVGSRRAGAHRRPRGCVLVSRIRQAGREYIGRLHSEI